MLLSLLYLVIRMLLRLLVRDSQGEAAKDLERFRRFRAALQEISVEPEPETLSLVASLRGHDEQ